MPVSFWNFPLMTNIKEVSPRPILLVAGENAHSRYYSEDAYAAAQEPKELVIVPGADTLISMTTSIRFPLTSWKPSSRRIWIKYTEVLKWRSKVILDLE